MNFLEAGWTIEIHKPPTQKRKKKIKEPPLGSVSEGNDRGKIDLRPSVYDLRDEVSITLPVVQRLGEVLKKGVTKEKLEVFLDTFLQAYALLGEDEKIQLLLSVESTLYAKLGSEGGKVISRLREAVINPENAAIKDMFAINSLGIIQPILGKKEVFGLSSGEFLTGYFYRETVTPSLQNTNNTDKKIPGFTRIEIVDYSAFLHYFILKLQELYIKGIASEHVENFIKKQERVYLGMNNGKDIYTTFLQLPETYKQFLWKVIGMKILDA